MGLHRWEDEDLDTCRLRVRRGLASVDGLLTLEEPQTERSRRILVLPEVVAPTFMAQDCVHRVAPPWLSTWLPERLSTQQCEYRVRDIYGYVPK